MLLSHPLLKPTTFDVITSLSSLMKQCNIINLSQSVLDNSDKVIFRYSHAYPRSPRLLNSEPEVDLSYLSGTELKYY